MVDQVADGAPALHHRVDPDRWRRTCAEVFLAMRAGLDRPPLDPYAATNPAEFFAVATECFFEKPRQLQERHPEVYGVLRGYYLQDPAGWFARSAGSPPDGAAVVADTRRHRGSRRRRRAQKT
jgi:Mlc titration factor MtfA (ptsG expression regulator)